MIYRCRFCDFERKAPLDLKVLRKFAQQFDDMHPEDLDIWLERINQGSDWFKAYAGVQVHMGRKHKDRKRKGDRPMIQMEPVEDAVIEAVRP